MLEIINTKKKYHFSSYFSFAAVISSLLVILSLVAFFTKMQYGVDFKGGAEIQAKFSSSIDLNLLRSTLKKDGFKGMSVQSIGDLTDNEYLIKVPANEANLNDVTDKLSNTLKNNYANENVTIQKVDIVGPKAGAQLRISGMQAILWALIAIMIYIGLRFDFKYSPGAIVALFHDISIILGIFAITGTEFTLQTVAALLAVIGYSVNDTVIVYDRVREHETKYPGVNMKDHIDNAISETLSRTILTSGTTLFISLAMYFFGGIAIKDFFMAISLGVIIGTYSSIFIAAPVTLFFNKFAEKNKAPVASLNV